MTFVSKYADQVSSFALREGLSTMQRIYNAQTNDMPWFSINEKQAELLHFDQWYEIMLKTRDLMKEYLAPYFRLFVKFVNEPEKDNRGYFLLTDPNSIYINLSHIHDYGSKSWLASQIFYVIVHELCHVLQAHYSLGYLSKIREEQLSEHELGHVTSSYAKTNRAEMQAEAFAHMVCNGITETQVDVCLNELLSMKDDYLAPHLLSSKIRNYLWDKRCRLPEEYELDQIVKDIIFEVQSDFGNVLEIPMEIINRHLASWWAEERESLMKSIDIWDEMVMVEA